ncbi:MAG: DNA-binding response regulator [Dehalococcoidia bacterium]
MTVARRLAVLIIDPNEIFRSGCRASFQTDSRFAVVADLPSAGTLATARLKADIDLAIVDPETDGGPDLDQLAMVRAALPSAALLLLTTQPDREFILRAADAGARAILVKTHLSSPFLLSAAHLIARSHASVLDQGLLLDLLNGKSRHAHAPALTHREAEVLQLLARGLTDQQIARALGIARTTVHSHVGALLRKTAAANRVQLGIIASRQGLLIEE